MRKRRCSSRALRLTPILDACLNFNVVDVERNQGGTGKGRTAWPDRVNAAPCGKDQAVEGAVVVAVVSGVSPPSDRLGNVVVAADEPS